MPILQESVAQTRIHNDENSAHLAFAVWARHGRPCVDRVEWIYTPASSGGQVHQVGRSDPIKILDLATAISFIRQIIFRFGVPHNIITYNGSNFDLDEFCELCHTEGTRVNYACMAQP